MRMESDTNEKSEAIQHSPKDLTVEGVNNDGVLQPKDAPAMKEVKIEIMSATQQQCKNDVNIIVPAQKPQKHRKSGKSLHLPRIENRCIEWVRSFDQQHNIYYYNATTAESAWLAPCSHCQKPADRWCIDCKLSFCDHDYNKKHKKDDMSKHIWQFKEMLDATPLQTGEEYCIACKRKAAFKICLTCWDPYCLACFALVHHVGALKMHKSAPFMRAKMGWTTVLKHGDGPDLYVHGETGETRMDKPDDLLSDWEKITIENTKNFREATVAHKARIESLLAELAVVEKERDVAVVEASKTMQVLRQKEADREKAASVKKVAKV